MVSICQCYRLASRNLSEKFFAKDEIAVFVLLHFWRCFYNQIATTTARTTTSKCFLFIYGGVFWILQLGGQKFREIVLICWHNFAILLNLKNIVKNSCVLNFVSKYSIQKEKRWQNESQIGEDRDLLGDFKVQSAFPKFVKKCFDTFSCEMFSVIA